jgi:hypothetical protein
MQHRQYRLLYPAALRHLVCAAGLASLFVSMFACNGSRVSGSYVAHSETFAGLLQLTQGEGGQITGMLYTADLRGGGVQRDQVSITGGTLDGDQLTLTLHNLFSVNVTGTLRWNTIRINGAGPNGKLEACEFDRGSPADFNRYSDELKLKAEGINLSAHLLSRSQQFRETMKRADRWTAEAELHAQRIAGVKDSYQRLEEKMRALVRRERNTPNPVSRGQLFVDVNQTDVAGTQADINVEQVWDRSIGDGARGIQAEFASYPTDCGIRKELQKKGATLASIETWETACKQIQTARTRFAASAKRIMAQREDLKAFQRSAEARRQSLVSEAQRIE